MWLVVAVIQFFQVYVFFFIKLISWQLKALATCPQSTVEWLEYLRFLLICIVLIPISCLVLLQYAYFSRYLVNRVEEEGCCTLSV